MILRRIDWHRVVDVQAGGSLLSMEEFQQQLAKFESEPPERFRFEEAFAFNMEQGRLEDGVVRRAPLSSARGVVPRQTRELDAVRSIAVEAYLTNWDADVEVDGIALHLYPLDGAGMLTAANGSLEVTLVGQYSAGYTAGGQFQTVGRWTRSMRAAERCVDGFVFRLPFQAVHPEFERELSKTGLLHVRLSVPGQGVFEASAAALRIRPYSPVRDRLEQVEDRRFFPIERTGRNH